MLLQVHSTQRAAGRFTEPGFHAFVMKLVRAGEDADHLVFFKLFQTNRAFGSRMADPALANLLDVLFG